MSIEVYKASAGSGKTYTLVYEYIKFLFEAYSHYVKSDLGHALNLHRRVLAVTFTNKATAEMKERIVKSLYELSEGAKKDYVKKLEQDIPSLIPADIPHIAQILLTDILQDYTQFRVSTIDGFFQQIVRSFARELNLNNQYKVELEQDRILELAVDNMLSSLGDENKKSLLEWLTDFASEQVEDAKSWNPRGKILKLAQLISSEEYVSQKEKFGFDLSKLISYRTHIRNIIKRFKDDLKQVCDVAQNILKSIDADNILIKNHISYLNYDHLDKNDYVVSSTFEKGAYSDDLNMWCKAKFKKDSSLQTVVSKLYECAKSIVEICDPNGKRFKEYQTALIVNSHLYILGILNEIDEHAISICRDKDSLLISSTADFINKIIDNSDTPFIYEKVGVSTNHFMIDEFQDTSRLQWSNFVPLLKESVSQGYDSMIVGDVKQSIYRWRNGDWRILHEGIKREFKTEVGEISLEKNYRSGKNIIDFNNKLYETIPAIIDSHLRGQGALIENEATYVEKIYANSKQDVGNQDKPIGYVRVEYFMDDEDDVNLTWRVQSLNHMVEEMKRIQCYGKMSVLVRVKAEAKMVAERLKSEHIPFISSEALCVADNDAVRFIIALFEYMIQPHEQLYRANLVALYRQISADIMLNENDHDLLSYRESNYFEWECNLFGTEDLVHRLEKIKYLPLLEMIDSVISLFNLKQINNGIHVAYLQSFIDKVQKFVIDGTMDIRSLLEFWEEQGEKTFIAMPEGGDAVRIMTIHSSKGLEFDVVFMPFVDWIFGFKKNNDTIQLLKTEGKTRENYLFLDDVSIVPVNINSYKKLSKSHFDSEIIEEFLFTCLDVLNVLYVATTRASQQLYLHCAEPKKDNIGTDLFSSIPVATILRQVLFEKESNETLYELGCSEYVEEKENKEELSDVINVELSYNEERLSTEAQIVERSKLRFTYSDDEGDSVRQYGVMMHKLFEQIITIKDIDLVVQNFVDSGLIEMKERDFVRAEIYDIFNIDGIADFFDIRWRVLNEVEIFDGLKDKIYRPDRLMIDDNNKEVIVLDYKFGEYTEDLNRKYTRQVAHYVYLIKQMGYTAKGYILYAKEKKLEQI